MIELFLYTENGKKVWWDFVSKNGYTTYRAFDKTRSIENHDYFVKTDPKQYKRFVTKILEIHG